jgi:hypothetical protein
MRIFEICIANRFTRIFAEILWKRAFVVQVDHSFERKQIQEILVVDVVQG